MKDIDIVSDYYKDSSDRERLIREAMLRIEDGEPCAYVLGEWFFYRNIFRLNEACLIPRPDTERIVEKAVSLIPRNGVFADLCTGSGCIAVSVLSERPDLRAFAFDISERALEAAKENAELLGVSDRIEFFCADLLLSDPLGERLFDCIISNPPYIKTSDLSALPLLAYEPSIALDGGSDGLTFYRRFIRKYEKNLSLSAPFIFEIGYDQRLDIERLAEENGFSCSVERDWGGNDRVAVLIKNKKD